ncbi:MAG: EAL domain-containing protein, partial [Planctomycetota bacterium]
VGYSSLNYLRQLPFDIIKLDRSLITEICECEKQRKIVEAVIMLGRSLGLLMVGEGIETEKQKLTVKEMGFDYGQGYLFAKPVPFVEAMSLIAADVLFSMAPQQVRLIPTYVPECRC